MISDSIVYVQPEAKIKQVLEHVGEEASETQCSKQRVLYGLEAVVNGKPIHYSDQPVELKKLLYLSGCQRKQRPSFDSF